MKTFGEVISELRKERGLTQKALAAQVKKKDGIAIGIAYINDIEHDRRNPPSPDFVAQLAAVLGVPLEVLQYYAEEATLCAAHDDFKNFEALRRGLSWPRPKTPP